MTEAFTYRAIIAGCLILKAPFGLKTLANSEYLFGASDDVFCTRGLGCQESTSGVI